MLTLCRFFLGVVTNGTDESRGTGTSKCIRRVAACSTIETRAGTTHVQIILTIPSLFKHNTTNKSRKLGKNFLIDMAYIVVIWTCTQVVIQEVAAVGSILAGSGETTVDHVLTATTVVTLLAQTLKIIEVIL